MTPINKTTKTVNTSWSASSGFSTRTDTSSFRDTLVCSPMNPGNFSSPTNWSYNATHTQNFKGKKTQELPKRTIVSYDTGYFGDSSTSPVLPTWERADLYNQALGRLNDMTRGGMDLSVDLAQTGQTLRMFGGVSKTLTFAKGLGPSAIANGWLEWQYGWKPLMGTIYDAANESVRFVLNRIERFSASASRRVEPTPTGSTTVASRVVPITRNGSGKQGCKFVIKLNVPDFDLARWSSLNPISIGWELIPYSFVVDWFVDIGSYLRNLETGLLYNTRFVSGYKDELFTYEGTEEVLSGTESTSFPASGPWFYYYGFKNHIRNVQFQRTVLTSYPLPNRPSIKAQLGWQRLTSGAALLQQILSRK